MQKIKVFFLVLPYFFILSCNFSPGKRNYDISKKELLVCKKELGSRTDNEKVIGCWTAQSKTIQTRNSSGVNTSYANQLIFYADSTMDDVTFFSTAGISSTQPLVYHNILYKISNGYLSYIHNGSSFSKPISIYDEHINFNGKDYFKSNCD